MAIGDGSEKRPVRVQMVRRVRNVEGPGTVQKPGDVLTLELGQANRLIHAGQALMVPDDVNPDAPAADEKDYPHRVKRGVYELSDGSTFEGNKSDAEDAEAALAEGAE